MSQQKNLSLRTANIVWLATALLHMDNKTRRVFQAKEIFNKVKELNMLKTSPATIRTYISHHCVANEDPSPNKDRKLFREIGGYRLYKDGDKAENRQGGKSAPIPAEIPENYRYVLDWYHNEYNNKETSKISLTVDAHIPFVSIIKDSNIIEIPQGLAKVLKTKRGEAIIFETTPDGRIYIKKGST